MAEIVGRREVLLSTAVARLGRYNDVVAAAYRTTFAFEEVIRCRAPDRRPGRPRRPTATLVLGACGAVARTCCSHLDTHS